MIRLLVSCALVAILSSVAVAERAPAPHFAQPPNADRVADPGERVVDPGLGILAPMLDRATLRAALRSARKTNLAAFRAYQRAGVFPSNTFQRKQLNVWRDDAGHYCAAATILRSSGQTSLADRVAEQTNFIRLADVQQGPLMDWILTSGFTQDEIAAIQEPFSPVSRSRSPEILLVDPKLRTAENQRLAARYAEVDKLIVKNEQRSLELAIDRLMKHQALAWQLVDRTSRSI